MAIASAGEVFNLVKQGLNVRAMDNQAKHPFRFLLCGDPALRSELRTTLLAGHAADSIPLDAAATLETIDPLRLVTVAANDVRCVIFVGRAGDAAGARLDLLSGLRVPILALTVDDTAPPSGPAALPEPGAWSEYVVPKLDVATLRPRFFAHLVECCKGVEVAAGRRLPALRETVAVKLTRDAAKNSLRVAVASAVVDHVPVLGLVLGAVASAGDMVAITGIQMMLMLQIGSVYGKDPDMQRMWEALPVVGGGFGWRMLSRELSGFIPVAGIFIKGAIAYAGTIVVGEGMIFYYQQGRHMSKAQASSLYAETKSAAMGFAREMLEKLRRKN